MKTCRKCHASKSVEDFHRNRARPDGRDHYCKACRLIYTKTPEQRQKANARNRPLKRATYASRMANPSERAREAQRHRDLRRRKGEAYRAYTRERYRRLYAPSQPRHKHRPFTWKPKTEEAARRRRERHLVCKTRYNRRPDIVKKRREDYYAMTPEQRQKLRERNREYVRRRRREDPATARKEAARIMVSLAVKHGWLTKEPCRDCGETRVQAHHPSYDHPLDVVWLCKPHHEAEHHPHLKVASGPIL